MINPNTALLIIVTILLLIIAYLHWRLERIKTRMTLLETVLGAQIETSATMSENQRRLAEILRTVIEATDVNVPGGVNIKDLEIFNGVRVVREKEKESI